MTDRTLFMIFGMVNAALYFSGVFIAGMIMRNDYAWKLALAGFGFTYLLYAIQVMMPEYDRTANAALWFSIALGVLSGFALLVRS